MTEFANNIVSRLHAVMRERRFPGQRLALVGIQVDRLLQPGVKTAANRGPRLTLAVVIDQAVEGEIRMIADISDTVLRFEDL